MASKKVEDITDLMRETEARVTPEEQRSWMYRNWSYMMRRCYRDKGYEGRSPKKAYKKAGVTVCDEWKDYFRFKKWALANGYDEERSNGENVAMRMCPGRIGNKGNFEPGNFEWITLNEEIRRWNHQSKWKRFWARVSHTMWDVGKMLLGIMLALLLICIMLIVFVTTWGIIRGFLGS